jgi:hypothetical protein
LTSHGQQTPPLELVEAVLQVVRPEGERLVTCDAPETVHLVLREKEGRRVLHIVNRARGERSVGPRRGWYRPVTIHSLPVIQPFCVSVATGKRPARVTWEPEGRELEEWEYTEGRVQLTTPPVDVHAMVVFELE